MESAPVELHVWFNHPAETVFGHCRHAADRTADRVQRTLLAVEKLTGEGDYTFYYATNEKACNLLHRELEDIGEPELRNSKVIHYGLALEILRGQRQIGARDCVTFLIEFDHEFSAEFVLALVDLMFYARETRGTKLRVLTTSKYDDIDASLARLQRLICPGIDGAVLVKVDTGTPVAEPPQLVPARAEVGNSFIVEAVRLIQEGLINGQCSVVMCHADESKEIRALLGGPTMDLNADAEELISANIKACETDVNRGVAIFQSKATRLPVKVPRLKTAIVSRFCNATIWQNGRLVKVAQETSQHEIQEMLDGTIETTTPTQAVEIYTPGDDPLRRLFPRRRVDGEQIWGLIVEVISRYRAVDCAELLKCLVTSPMMLDAAFKQLCIMGCLKKRPESSDGSVYFFKEQELGMRLLQLLPLFGYNIFPAWFLVVGLASPGATPTATRAMIRIAAMESLPGSILSRFDMDLRRPDVELQLARVAEGIARHFCMPAKMYLQGHVWICLAVYEASFRISNGFTGTTVVRVLEAPVVSVSTAATTSTANLVPRIEALLEMQANAQPFSLSSDDCRTIQQAMTDAWVYRFLHIRSRMSRGQVQITTEDPMINHGGLLVKAALDMWPVDEALGRYRNEIRAIIVAAEIERPLTPAAAAPTYSRTAVLPFVCIANWQDRNPGLWYLHVVREFQ